jgi:hypothetical protein
MRKLYARFYENTNDPVPKESNFICVDNCGGKETIDSLSLQSYNIRTWMIVYPLGKVEFVWQ